MSLEQKLVDYSVFYNTFHLLMLKCLINNVVRHRTYCQYNRVLCTLSRNALIISNYITNT